MTYTVTLRVGLLLGTFGLLLTVISSFGYFLVFRPGDFGGARRVPLFFIRFFFGGVSADPSNCGIFSESLLKVIIVLLAKV